ncbi:hypothetical protein [Lacinutrix sp.]|uniref:hypothetical protein n=1 Tax=Lacinutrix sp. TaxID=1937692 RepID=UPI0035C87779
MSDQLNTENNNSNDQLETGLKVLAFCIPLAGAIIYFTSKEKSPNKAKQACNFALYGIGFGLVVQIISYVITGSM